MKGRRYEKMVSIPTAFFVYSLKTVCSDSAKTKKSFPSSPHPFFLSFLHTLPVLRLPVLTALLFILLTPGIKASSLQEPASKKQATQYIEMLKSDDDTKRIEGKTQLLQLGDQSIAALLPLLDDLIKQQNKFWLYPEDKEEWEKLERQIDRGKLFREDVMELLGRLHAREAIPLLIDSVDARRFRIKNIIRLNVFTISPEMAALIEIGSPAVPQILHTIESAEAQAKREADEGVVTSTQLLFAMDENSATRTQIRLAMILGEIGDVRALPVLEELDKRRGHTTDIQVQQAITKIKAKNNLK